ncbi:MAG TPA: hypothetical protein VFX15_03650 [Actinomycetes bacterium]|nr:hypothetical protein [Actinomycetes bacterium]
MINEAIRRDAAHLSLLTSQARAFEQWYDEQAEPIRKRLARRRIDDDKLYDIGALELALPPSTIFEQYRCLDLGLRQTAPPAHEDRKYLAEVRCWLRDGMDELCAFELDSALDLLALSVERLDWLLHGRSRAGSRRYRILDEESKLRITGALAGAEALLAEAVKVRQLVTA